MGPHPLQPHLLLSLSPSFPGCLHRLASLMFPQHARHCSASGPLHFLLCPYYCSLRCLHSSFLLSVLPLQWGLFWLSCLKLHTHTHTHIPYPSIHASPPPKPLLPSNVLCSIFILYFFSTFLPLLWKVSEGSDFFHFIIFYIPCLEKYLPCSNLSVNINVLQKINESNQIECQFPLVF